MQNHFALFQLPARFDIDLGELDRAYREVQSQVHPDKFVHGGSAEQRVAMQWATRANEAYQTLKNPLHRARYLCELNGVELQTESNTAMPPAFLMQQIEWREELEAAGQDAVALQRLEDQVSQAHRQQLTQIAQQLALPDFHQAAQFIRQLMFLEKFSEDIDHALAQAD